MYEFHPYFTNDGSVGLYNPEYNDVYHSATGALSEAYEKFILPVDIMSMLNSSDEFKVLDICYGIGYNSKSFLNFVFDEIYKNNFKKNNYITKPNIAPIYTNNKSCKISSNCNYAIYGDNIFDKISITAIDNDKNLAFLSPFIQTGVKNYKNENLNFEYEKIKNYIKAEKNISNLEINNLINYLIFDKIVEKYPEILENSSVSAILSNKALYKYFNNAMLKVFKHAKTQACNLSFKDKILGLLHNIYYHHVSNCYKNNLKSFKLDSVKFDLNFDDARHFIKNDKNTYNLIFLDAFSPTKCPCLWSYEFFNELYNHLDLNGAILTYSSAASVRAAMLEAGFYVGNIFSNRENKFIGTIAAKNKDLIKYNLSERDLSLLKTTAGIFYRDKNFTGQNEAIIAARNEEVKKSNRINSSAYLSDRKKHIINNNYDVIVVGGGTAGCAAAYTAGKLGLSTLLIEKSSHLGGAITSGLVVPVMQSGKNQINTEFYDILVSELKKINGQITYKGNSGWFNPELTKIVLDKMLRSMNVDILFNTEISDVKISNSLITHIGLPKSILSPYTEVIYSDNNLSGNSDVLLVYIGAKYIFDTTGNCDFSKKINCEFLDDNLKTQPMSLRFMMSGIDIKQFEKWILRLDKDRNVTTSEHVNDEIHLSTAYTWDTDKKWALAPLFDDAVNKGILKSTDRNYFQIFTVAGMPGTIAFNCPRIPLELDPNCTSDTSKALIIGREMILRLSNFCKIYFPGFRNSYISNIADSIGIRVSSRIKGKYVYTYEDLKSGKKFDNPVLISNYPVDVHNSKKNASKLNFVNDYQLPIESLISNDYDNLLVAGRGVSADFLAQGALRVQASCFSMGEAIAKYVNSKLRLM